MSAHQHALGFIVTNYPHFRVAVVAVAVVVGFCFCAQQEFLWAVSSPQSLLFSVLHLDEQKKKTREKCVCVWDNTKKMAEQKEIDNERFKSKKFFRNFHGFQREIVLMRQREHAK